jgi:hypothetical protein
LVGVGDEQLTALLLLEEKWTSRGARAAALTTSTSSAAVCIIIIDLMQSASPAIWQRLFVASVSYGPNARTPSTRRFDSNHTKGTEQQKTKATQAAIRRIGHLSATFDICPMLFPRRAKVAFTARTTLHL